TLMAVLLYNQQQSVTEALSENVGSRRAAADLEESLNELVNQLKSRPEDVKELHQRIKDNLDTISNFADKERERQLSEQLDKSFGNYRAIWESRPESGPKPREAITKAIDLLEKDTLKHCRDLRDYNAHLIEESEKEQSKAVRRLAWGFGAVG